MVVEADITDAAAVQNLLDTTLKAFPKGVDVLVNNAAYVAPIHRSSWLIARQGISCVQVCRGGHCRMGENDRSECVGSFALY